MSECAFTATMLLVSVGIFASAGITINFLYDKITNSYRRINNWLYEFEIPIRIVLPITVSIAIVVFLIGYVPHKIVITKCDSHAKVLACK